MSASLLEKLHKVVNDYNPKKADLTPVEFIEAQAKVDQSLDVDVVRQFLNFIKYQPILRVVSEDFIQKYYVCTLDDVKIALLLYLVIFELSSGNHKVFQGFLEGVSYGEELTQYLGQGGNQINIAKEFCAHFDKDFVLDNVIYPLVNKQGIIRSISEHIEKKRTARKAPTVPEDLNVLRKNFKSFNPPPNTPATRSCTKIKMPGRSKDSVPLVLEEEYKTNRVKALALLEMASERTKVLAQPKVVVETTPEVPKILPIKAKKPPPKKPVEVRDNLTSTLRQANVYLKEQESEINRIEDLIKGGICKEDIAELEAEKRLKEQQKHLEEIQRKHLLGMLSYEDAILAKKNQMIANKEKINKFKESKAKIFEDLEKWKEQEQAKVKDIVHKIKDIEKGAKEAEKKVQEEKQNNAKLLQYESKQLLKQFYEDNQKELEKKMQLIQEIRAMEQVRRTLAVKGFDPTESPNYGLLCEMSIAELQERLALTNIKMKEELEAKRKKIQQGKLEQEKMITSMKTFIDEYYQNKCGPKIPKPPKELQHTTPEIDKMRLELEKKRKLRKNAQ